MYAPPSKKPERRRSVDADEKKAPSPVTVIAIADALKALQATINETKRAALDCASEFHASHTCTLEQCVFVDTLYTTVGNIEDIRKNFHSLVKVVAYPGSGLRCVRQSEVDAVASRPA